jgi:hypothetical protein
MEMTHDFPHGWAHLQSCHPQEDALCRLRKHMSVVWRLGVNTEYDKNKHTHWPAPKYHSSFRCTPRRCDQEFATASEFWSERNDHLEIEHIEGWLWPKTIYRIYSNSTTGRIIGDGRNIRDRHSYFRSLCCNCLKIIIFSGCVKIAE